MDEPLMSPCQVPTKLNQLVPSSSTVVTLPTGSLRKNGGHQGPCYSGPQAALLQRQRQRCNQLEPTSFNQDFCGFFFVKNQVQKSLKGSMFRRFREGVRNFTLKFGKKR
jgi:hypothetical protein